LTGSGFASDEGDLRQTVQPRIVSQSPADELTELERAAKMHLAPFSGTYTPSTVLLD
jgi:hypothetical protein